MGHENTWLLAHQKLDYHCQSPPKTLKKIQKNWWARDTHIRDPAQILQWYQPLTDVRAYRSYTHTLLGVEREGVRGPDCPPVQ